MRRAFLPLLALALAVCVVGNIASAAPFEPLFTVKTITGECTITITERRLEIIINNPVLLGSSE